MDYTEQAKVSGFLIYRFKSQDISPDGYNRYP